MYRNSTEIQEVQMSSTLVRVGGVAAVIASLLIVGQQAWGLAGGGAIEEGMGESALHTAQMLVMVFGVIGIALAQQRRAGVFAQIAALVAVLGCVAMYGAALTEVTILPSLVETGSPLAKVAPPAMDIAALSSFIAWVTGLLLLAAAVLVTKVLPRTPAVLLGLGVILGLGLNSVVPGVLIVYAIGFGWLGVAAVHQAGHDAAAVTASTDPASGQEHAIR
jgi:hypothetical protein